jgi:anthranilate synthase component I
MSTFFDIAADLHTPVSAFLRLAPLHPHYLLETVEGGHQGRYSFIGFGSGNRVSVMDDGVHVNDAKVSNDVLAGLRAGLGSSPRLQPALDIGRFSGGLVGAAGFDLVRHLYRLPPRGSSGNGAVASYLATESVLVFDHLTRRIGVLHHSETERDSLRRELLSLLHGPISRTEPSGGYTSSSESLSRSDFLSGVEKVKRHIAAGDIYQLVLSIRFSGRTDLDPFQVYRALRILNPSPYMYFLDFGDHQVVGSSPEALARLDGQTAEIWPIAGTRPRGADSDEDAILERELLADPKEAAEHVMLVDLARNDLGRTAVPGTVQVGPFRTVERYSHVMHMVSGVTGRLSPGLDSFDLFAAAFPAGTVVGAPKLAAIELIDELEPVPRGLYSGSVGYFGADGAMDQAITIRTAIFEGDTYSYQAGAGIVADSDPELEHQEVLSKGAAIRAAFDLAEEGL